VFTKCRSVQSPTAQGVTRLQSTRARWSDTQRHCHRLSRAHLRARFATARAKAALRSAVEEHVRRPPVALLSPTRCPLARMPAVRAVMRRTPSATERDRPTPALTRMSSAASTKASSLTRNSGARTVCPTTCRSAAGARGSKATEAPVRLQRRVGRRSGRACRAAKESQVEGEFEVAATERAVTRLDDAVRIGDPRGGVVHDGAA